MGRLNKIDELRGLTLISMVLYHFCWDLKFIAGFDMDWYVSTSGKIWQKSICITFILISGFCFSMGRKRFKRSMTVFLCGLVITLVTLIFMPSNRIVFGVLTFIGTAGLLTIPVDRMISRRIAGAGSKDRGCGDGTGAGYAGVKLCKLYVAGLIVSLVLFIIFFTVNKHYLNFIFTRLFLPEALFKGYVSTFLGFTDRTFFSTDYFALLPWYFLYLCGYFLYKIYVNRSAGSKIGFYGVENKDDGRLNADVSISNNAGSKNTEVSGLQQFLAKSSCTPLSFLGRHSLIIYMLHQPVLYAITLILIRINI